MTIEIKNTVVEGDSLKVLPTLEAQSFDLCITHPPYWDPERFHLSYEEYIGSLLTMAKEIKRVLKPNGVFWLLLGDSKFTTKFGMPWVVSMEIAKNNIFPAKGYFLWHDPKSDQLHYIFQFGNKKLSLQKRIYTAIPRIIEGYPYETTPEYIIRQCLLASALPGQKLIDPFCGANTIGRVAESYGVSSLGIDIALPEVAKQTKIES